MQGGKLELVGRPEVFRIPRDERRAYLSHQHMQVREAVSRQIAQRPRLVGQRPTMRLYKTAAGYKAPLATAFHTVEDMAVQRDQERDERKLILHDTAIPTLAWTLVDYANDAIDASNQRREAAKRGESA